VQRVRDKRLKNTLESLSPGDLICVDWYDASIGKSLGTGVDVDVPVKSWGIFLGVLGHNNKHIILAQNDFLYSDGVYDIDYTAVPVTWTCNVELIVKSHVHPDTVKHLLSSFLMGGRKRLHKAQNRVANHHD
jgi:hypothetical protein